MNYRVSIFWVVTLIFLTHMTMPLSGRFSGVMWHGPLLALAGNSEADKRVGVHLSLAQVPENLHGY